MPSKPGYIYKPASFIDSLAFASATKPEQAAIIARHGTAIVTGNMNADDNDEARSGSSGRRSGVHHSRSSSLKTNSSSSSSHHSKRRGSNKPVRHTPKSPRVPHRLLPRSSSDGESPGLSLRGMVGEGSARAADGDSTDMAGTVTNTTTTTTTTTTATEDIRGGQRGTGLRRADAVAGRPTERTERTRRRRVRRAESRSRVQSQSQSQSQREGGSSRGEGVQLDERYLLPAPLEEDEEERFENGGRQQGEYSTPPRETIPIPAVEADAPSKQQPPTPTRDSSAARSRYVRPPPIEDDWHPILTARVPPPTTWKRLKTHISKSSLRPSPSPTPSKHTSSLVSPAHHTSFLSSTSTDSSTTATPIFILTSYRPLTPRTTNKQSRSCLSYSPARDPLYSCIPRDRTAHFPGELVIRDFFEVKRGSGDAEPRVSVYAVEKPMYGVIKARAGKADAREVVEGWVEKVEEGLPEEPRPGYNPREHMFVKHPEFDRSGVPRLSVVTAWPEVQRKREEDVSSDEDEGQDEKGIRRMTLRPEDSLSAVQDRKWRRGELVA